MDRRLTFTFHDMYDRKVTQDRIEEIILDHGGVRQERGPVLLSPDAVFTWIHIMDDTVNAIEKRATEVSLSECRDFLIKHARAGSEWRGMRTDLFAGPLIHSINAFIIEGWTMYAVTGQWTEAEIAKATMRKWPQRK